MKKNIAQTKNPRSGLYIKVDRSQGRIIGTKKSPGPYKNIPIMRKEKRDATLWIPCLGYMRGRILIERDL